MGLNIASRKPSCEQPHDLARIQISELKYVQPALY
jgi:hypothetical protein